MSTSPDTMPRIEVVYPERPSLLRARRAPEMSRPKGEHLIPVGRINSDGEVYADESVIDEVDMIRHMGFRVNSLVYHATSSAALPAIARHGALLSSEQLLKIQEPLVTGEITTDEGWLHRHTNGLPDVYASGSPVSTQYAQVTGDNYPVIFGIDPRRLESRPSTDNGDGMRLGARVALGCVAAHIVSFDKILETKEWAEKNCPEETITMSSDAAFMLTYGLGYRT